MLLGNRRGRRLCRGVRLRVQGVLKIVLLVKMGLLERASEVESETLRDVIFGVQGKARCVRLYLDEESDANWISGI